MLKKSRKHFFIIIFLCMAFLMAETASFAAPETNTVIKEVSSSEEFVAALNGSASEIRITQSFSISGPLNVTKTVRLAWNTLTVSSGVVYFSSVKNGTIRGNGGTAVLRTFDKYVTVLDNVRTAAIFNIDAPDGKVTSVKYNGSQDKDVESDMIKGSVVSGGRVTLYVKLEPNKGKNKVAQVRTPKVITVDGVDYELIKSNQYAHKFSIMLKQPNGEVFKALKASAYQRLTLPEMRVTGFVFKGWTSDETGELQQKALEAGEITRDMSFTAVLEEDPNAEEGGFSGKGFSGGISGRGFSGGKGGFSAEDIALVDENGEEIEEEEAEEEKPEGKEGTAPEGDQPGGPGSQNRPKRVSVASEKTRAAFESGAPRTEDVGVTIETDPNEKIRLYALGGGIVLAAVVLLVLLGRSGRKRR